MADNKNKSVIIIKKIQGGHAGAHGGAWKVAYADFVTAMMAFFLVMWLLGSDEEIKAAVAQYFNNPSSAWRPDLSDKKMVPLGDKTGAGDSVLNGQGGETPEDMIERPSRPFVVDPKNPRDIGEQLSDVLNTRKLDIKMDLELFKFSVPETKLFKAGSDELLPEAEAYLNYVGTMLKGYQGFLTLRVPDVKSLGYEFSMSRMQSVKSYFLKNKIADSEKIVTQVAGDSPYPILHPEDRKIEFTFSKAKSVTNSERLTY